MGGDHNVRRLLLVESAVLIALAGADIVFGTWPTRERWLLVLALGALDALIMGTSITVFRRGGRVRFAPDNAVVAASVILLPTPAIVLVFAVGNGARMVMHPRSGLRGMDGFIGAILPQVLAVSLVHLVVGPGLSWETVIGGFIAGCLSDGLSLVRAGAYGTVTRVSRFSRFLRDGLGVIGPLTPCIAATGVVGAVLSQRLTWMLPFFAGTVVLILVSGRERVISGDEQSGLRPLLLAATEIQRSTDAEAILEIALRAAAEMLHGLPARLSAEPGEAGSVGAPLHGVPTPQYLIVSRPVVGEAFAPDDQGMMSLLCQITSAALERAPGQRQLERDAVLDPLTGLCNRREFERALANALVPSDAAAQCAVVYLDLDGFKPINDIRGHAVGDLVLQEVARRLERTVRPGDVVARMGGDEFTVLLHRVHGEAEVRVIGDRLVSTIGAPLSVDGVPAQVTPSIGIALGNQTSDAAELVAAADAAMYAAKQEGKNRWRLAPDRDAGTTATGDVPA